MIFPSGLSIGVGICFGVVVAMAAYFAKALSRSGAITAAIMGTIIFGLGGWGHTAVLLTFFLSSSLLSKFFKKRKIKLDEKYAKGNRRDAGQVLANGGVALFSVILAAIFPGQPIFWWMYCAALAAANADTWATELGVLSGISPRLITNWKKVEMGTSGGITPVGTISALGGAGLVALVAYAFHPGWVAFISITLAGLAGSIIDSCLGATIQAMYYCDSCKKETEKHPIHGCGQQTHLIHGKNWMNNDMVNALCTLSGALITGGLFLL